MSQLRRVASGLAQSWTNPMATPKPPVISYMCRMNSTRSSGVPITDEPAAAAAVAPPVTASTAASGLS